MNPHRHVSVGGANVTTFVWQVPEGVLDAHVVAQFATAVQAKDMAYFYGLANSKGGQG